MTISCSQQKATKAEFSFTIGAISTSSFPGGLMIYGQNATKTAVFGQRHFSGPMALDLQNGDWQFFAVGWAGTSPLPPVLSRRSFPRAPSSPRTLHRP
ncbi:MAG: hypothetical protein ACLGG7_13545 [Bacteriovoracia bacterium]